MIKSIQFENYRNLNAKYSLDSKLNIICGNNNSGKSNLLDGIKLAFSAISNEYVRVKKSDFLNSDDSKTINIYVELVPNAIPSLQYLCHGVEKCGFKVSISRASSGRYKRRVTLLNGSQVEYDILQDDPQIPNICVIPFVRSEDLYTDGLMTGISAFIDSEEKYRELKNEYRDSMRKEMQCKIDEFRLFCKKFNQNLDVEFNEPRLIDEKAYIVDGKEEHNYRIGSGYKSIANIILNALKDSNSIILIDELENHLHPSVLRTLIREIREIPNAQIIATTHSPIVVNEATIEELKYITGINFSELNSNTRKKLNTFLHPGRAEIVFSEKIVLVEGYSEEIILKAYLKSHGNNWTIVNVGGIMFLPYIELARFLGKKIVVVSDDDRSLSEENDKSNRFKNLEEYCCEKNVPIIAVYNTLESDLFKNGFLQSCGEYLKPNERVRSIYVAKNNQKTAIAEKLVEERVDLSEWHVVKEIENVLESD